MTNIFLNALVHKDKSINLNHFSPTQVLRWLQSKAGAGSELKVVVQDDRTVMLESAKNPGQYFAIASSGKPLSVQEAKPEYARFYIYCKVCNT